MALFKQKEIKKQRMMKIRIAQVEKRNLEAEVEILNIGLTEYLLRCALSKPIHTSNLSNVGVELIHVGSQQKAIWRIDKSQEEIQRKILVAVADAISDLPERISNKIPEMFGAAEGAKKDAIIKLRLFEDDWVRINQLAQGKGLSASEFIRVKALNRSKSPHIIRDTAAQLINFQNMLKDLVSHSLFKSPIYLTVQLELLEDLKLLPIRFRNDCYIRTEWNKTRD